MKRLDVETWKIVFRNLSEVGEEVFYNRTIDCVEVVWLDPGSNSEGEWVLSRGVELLEDGFKSEGEAMKRLENMEKMYLNGQFD